MQAIFTEIATEIIEPSPYQKRQVFDAAKLQSLANDIELNGLLNPVLCRPQGCNGCKLLSCPGQCSRFSLNGYYELMHGERRLRASKLIPWSVIPSQVRSATDLQARRIVAAENVHRVDLTPIELIEATAEWVDACLCDDGDYVKLGQTYLERVRRLLNILWNRNRRGNEDNWTYKFISPVIKTFEDTNRNITWESFYNNDLRPYLNLDEDVKDVCIEYSLAKSKAPELQKLKEVAPTIFEEIKETGKIDLGTLTEEKFKIEEVSAREIGQKAKYEQAKGCGMGVHFSSDTSEWYTPPQIIKRVIEVMGEIDLDPCSNSHTSPNVPARQHYTKRDDGLKQEWHGRVYMNPPYGLEITDWVNYLCRQFEVSSVIEAIALLPSRTDTEWFRRLRQYPRCFIWGRLRFSGNDIGAPFPSMAVYLGRNIDRFMEAFEDIGDIYAWSSTDREAKSI